MAFSLSVVLYVVLDGADLGAGVFSLFVRNADERGAIMSAMAGTWDANETWLIVAGGVLFATFPFVYGSAFSYLMVPLAFALWGMITRAVALEFRHLADARWQRFSDYAFGVSSLTVAFFGGMALGAVMMGFPLTHEAGTVPTYVGGAPALHFALQHLDRHRFGDRGDARRRFVRPRPLSPRRADPAAGGAVGRCDILSGVGHGRDHHRLQHGDLPLGSA